MVLFLKIISNLFQEDALDYLDTEKVQDLVKNYSQFISFPIYVGREKPAVAKVGFSYPLWYLCLYCSFSQCEICILLLHD